MQETGTPAPSIRPATATRPAIGEMIVAAVLIAASIAVFAAASDVRGANEHEPLGPALMPRLFAASIFIGACIVFVRTALVWWRDHGGAYRERSSTGRSPSRGLARPGIQVAVMLALLCLYAFALPRLGYIVCTAAFAAAAMGFFGSRQWLGLIVFPVLTALGLYAGFTYGLDVRLP